MSGCRLNCIRDIISVVNYQIEVIFELKPRMKEQSPQSQWLRPYTVEMLVVL